jgi:hypothetical protein
MSVTRVAFDLAGNGEWFTRKAIPAHAHGVAASCGAGGDAIGGVSSR